jgi:hypothetical protein
VSPEAQRATRIAADESPSECGVGQLATGHQGVNGIAGIMHTVFTPNTCLQCGHESMHSARWASSGPTNDWKWEMQSRALVHATQAASLIQTGDPSFSDPQNPVSPLQL